MTEASELRGILIVAQEEGAQLGTVTGINVDIDDKVVAAIRFRPRGLSRKESYVGKEDVGFIGRDVIFVSSEAAVASPEDVPAPGRSLHDLQGTWVTTVKGRHLGTLVDLDFDPETWKICLLKLEDDRQLAVDAGEIDIGDEIMVPAAYEDSVLDTKKPKQGIMARILGNESIEDLSRTLKRAVRREPDADEDAPADEAARAADDDDDETIV